MNDKQIPPSVGEFAIGERDQLLARVAELEATQKIEIDFDSPDGFEPIPSIEKVIAEIAHMANKHNDNDDWELTEQVARSAVSTALYNHKLLSDCIAALKQPSAGVDERSAFEESGLKSSSSVWHEGCYQYKTIDDEGEEYFTAGLGLDNLKWQAWQARAQLAAPAGVPDGWYGFVEYAKQLLNAEQTRLSAEDYIMDSDDCIEVLQEAATPSAAPAKPKGCTKPGCFPYCDCDSVDALPVSDVVPVPRELLERIVKRGMRLPDETQHLHLEQINALLNGGRS